MLLTEQEASTKRCQEGYAASPGAAKEPVTEYTVVQHAVAVSGISAGVPTGIVSSHEPKTAPIFCLGSACMAWRWAGWRHSDGRVMGHRPAAPDDPQVGYCGKAGVAHK